MGVFARGEYPWAGSRRLIVAAYVLIAATAVADWLVLPNVALGFLYLIAITLAAPVSSRVHLVLLSTACAVLREVFSPFAADDQLPARFLMVLVAFLASGLFVRELARNNELALENQTRLRALAEHQSRMLIESTLAAVLIADEQGNIVLANEAAHRLFGFDRQSLAGESLESLLPVAALPEAPLEQISTRMVECTARRRDGQPFFAQVWVSRFPTEAGSRVAALVFDASQERRDREQDALQCHLTNSRVIMGAVWHEVGSLCAAVGAIWANLNRISPQQPEVRTLGTLVKGLQQLLSENAGGRAEQAGPVDLRMVLEELRIIVEPDFRELGACVRWRIPADLPPVRATRHGLLQVLLNLAQNARRALEDAELREFALSAHCERGRVYVRCWNSGPAVPDSRDLFRPFQQGADGHGLGLYVSRAMIRGFGGDLRHLCLPRGCCFEVELAAMPPQPAVAEMTLAHANR